MLERLPFLFSIKFISDYFDCNTYIRQAKDPHLAARAVGIFRPSLFMYGIWHMVHAICFIE